MTLARTPSLRARLLSRALTAALLSVANPALGQALPSGGVVTAGAAEIGAAQGGSMTVTQSSHRAVIDWKSFQIGKDGEVDFRQAANAAILNRVTGADASVIAGALRASGAVYLVNPNGLFVTKDGLVDAKGGFIGSTLGIRNDDFMAGRDRFTGPATGAVINDGRIQVGAGGFVGLLGGSVSNDGVIVAPRGRVELKAGSAATLDLNGDGFLQVVVADDEKADADPALTDFVVRRQDPEGGVVALRASAARNAVRETVNVPAALQARGVSGVDGAVALTAGAGEAGAVSVGGLIDVSGDAAGGTIRIDGGATASVTGVLKADGRTGGRIDLTADDVTLSGATLSARGVELGGVVRVGGAFQGGREQDLTTGDGLAYVGRFGAVTALRSATNTAVDAATRIEVGADGRGGAAVIWSARRTTFDGLISAGNGAVEVSAKDSLARVNLRGIALSAGGRLLLDPKNIIVSDAADGDPPHTTQNYAFGDGPADTILWAVDVADLLSTGASLTLQANNDLFVYRSILVSNSGGVGGDLTLQAGRSVELHGAIQTDGGSLTVIANATAGMGVIDAERDGGLAYLDASDANILANGGNVTLSILDGAGLSNTDGDYLRVGSVSGNNITLSNSGSGRRVMLFDQIAAGGALTFTGDLFFAMSGGDFSGQSVTWTNESSGAIRAEGSDPFRFIANGTVTRYGVLQGGSDATRLALGPDTPATYTRVYGDANPTLTGDTLRIVAGSLQGSDTLADILTANALDLGGPAANAAVGTSALTISASSNFAFATSEHGYWVDLTPAQQTLTITARPITATLTGATYVYGSPSPIATFSGALGGDQLTLAVSVSGQGNTNLGGVMGGLALPPRTDAGTRTVTVLGLAGSAAGNYSLDVSGIAPVSVTITPRTLTYACCAATTTYGNAPPTLNLNFNGILGGDVVSATGAEIAATATGAAIALTDRTHAGTYVIRAAGLTGADAGNYVLSTTGATNPTLTINRRAVTYIAGGSATTYGDAPNHSLTGVLSGDVVSGVLAVQQGAGAVVAWTPRTDVGTYTISLTGLTGANGGDYQIAGSGNTNLSVTIQPRPLSLTPAGGSFVYGSTTASPAGLTGLVDGDDVSVELLTVLQGGGTVTLAANTPVGTYNVIANSISGADAGNYSFTGGTGTISITPKPITYSIAGGTAEYGAGGLGPGGVTLTGVLAGDAAAISGTVGLFDSQGAATTLSASSDAGTYTARVTALTSSNPAISAANYTLASSGNADGQLIITPKALTYSISNVNGTYGTGGTIGLLFSLTGFVGSEFARPVWTLTSSGGQAVALGASGGLDAPNQVGARTAAGSYVIDMSGFTAAVNGFKASNYTVSGTAGTLTIAPKPITYTIGNISGVYGSTTLPGATLNGVLSGDAVVASGVQVATGGGPVALAANTDVGTYNVSVTALSGADAGNYTLAASGNADGVLTIVPKLLSWSVGAVTGVYGDHPGLGTAQLDGVIAGDTVSATVTAYAPGASPDTLASTCNGAPCYPAVDPAGFEPLNAGAYPLIVSGLTGADAANYRIVMSGDTGVQSQTRTPGVLTITPRPITLRVHDFWTYYSRMSGLTPSYGIMSGQVLNAADLPLATLNPAPGQTAIAYSLPGGSPNVGDYTVTAVVFGGASANYAFTIEPGTLQIRPLPVRATVGSARGTYGDTLASMTNTVSATFTAQDAVGGFAGPSYELRAQAGQVNGRLNAGTYNLGVALTDPNYVLVSQAFGVLTVDKRRLTVGGSVSTVFGDSLARLTPTGLLPGDDFSILIQSVTNIATGKAIDVTRLWDASGRPTVVSSQLPGIGSYAVTSWGVIGTTGLNYEFDFAGRIEIAPRPITIASFDTTVTTYGDRLPISDAGFWTGRVTYNNLVSGGDAFGIAPYMGPQGTLNAGTHQLSASAIDTVFNGASVDCSRFVCVGANYVLASSGNATAEVRVQPRTVTWSVANASTTYGDAVQQTAVLTGVLAQDAANLRANLAILDRFADQTLFVNPATSTDGRNFNATLLIAPAGTYRVSVDALTGAAAGNYTVAPAPSGMGQLTIAQRPLTFTTASATSYFGIGAITDSAADLGRYTLSGLVGADQVGVTLGISFGGSATSDLADIGQHLRGLSPGVYPILVTSLTGDLARNYTIATQGNSPGNLTSLDFYALNQLTALENPATQVVNAIKTAQATAAAAGANGSPASNALPPTTAAGSGGAAGAGDGTTTTPPAGAQGVATASSTSSNNGISNTSAGAGAELGALEGGCDNPEECTGVRNLLEAWAGVSASFDDFRAGAVAKDEFTSRVNFDCGNTACSFDMGASVEVGAYAEVRNVISDTEVTIAHTYLAGYGVEAEGSFGASGALGSVDAGLGVTAGKFGIGGEGTSKYENGVITIGLQFELHMGVGLSIDFSVGFDVALWSQGLTCAYAGCTTSYETVANPQYALERKLLAAEYSDKIETLKSSERGLVEDVLAGRFNDNPEGFKLQVDALKAAEQRLLGQAANDGFGLNFRAGEVTDRKPPEMTTVYVNHDGLGQQIADGVTDLFDF